jgi:hypothetical protein
MVLVLQLPAKTGITSLWKDTGAEPQPPAAPPAAEEPVEDDEHASVMQAITTTATANVVANLVAIPMSFSIRNYQIECPGAAALMPQKVHCGALPRMPSLVGTNDPRRIARKFAYPVACSVWTR